MKKRNFFSRIHTAFSKALKRGANEIQLWQSWFDRYFDLGNQEINLSSSMKIATVYAIVRVIAESFASLPIEIIQKSNGKTKKATELPEYYLLKVKPNPYCNAFTFWEAFITSAFLDGNGYAWIERIRKGPGAGSAKAIWFLHPDQVTVYLKGREKILKVVPLYRGGVITEEMILYPGDYLHMPVLSGDGIMGRSFVSLLKPVLENIRDQVNWQKLFFKQGVRPGAVLTTDNPLDEDEAKMVSEVLNASSSGENAHKALLLPFGLKWTPITMKAEDVQILDQFNLSERQLCGAARVPQPMIQNHENSTYSNTEQLNKALLDHCIRPWAERVEAVLNEQLLTKDQYLAGYYTKTNLNALQRAALKERGEFYMDGIQAGWLLRSEARELEDLDSIEGLDEPLVPLNMVTEKEKREAKEAEQKALEDAKNQPDPKKIEDRSMVKVEVIDDKARSREIKELVSGYLSDTLKRIHSRERKELIRNSSKMDAREFQDWLEKFLAKHDEYYISNVLPVARRLSVEFRCDDHELEKRIKRLSSDQVNKLRSMVRVALAEADGNWLGMRENLDRKCHGLELGASESASYILTTIQGDCKSA